MQPLTARILLRFLASGPAFTGSRQPKEYSSARRNPFRRRSRTSRENHSEIGVHAAHCLSQDYQAAYRDIHDLVLTRSSTGKLARLLLSQAAVEESENEARMPYEMTHEEMARRIGASRETVTRLLSILRKRQLIRLDGPTLIIRDRSGLEALTT